MSATATRVVPEVDPLLAETATAMMRDLCTSEAIRESEGKLFGGLWSELADSGLAAVGVAEAAGGSGGTQADLATIVRVAGQFAAPVPLAEHALLGGWLLERAGGSLPAGPVSVAPGVAGSTVNIAERGTDWQVTGAVSRVAWGGEAVQVVIPVASGSGEYAIVVEPGQYSVQRGANLAGEPRDTLEFDIVVPESHVLPVPEGTREMLRRRGALSRSLLIAGALESALALATRHAQDRHQFGQSISRFQAVGQRLAMLAEEVTRANAAADLAVALLGDDEPAANDVAVVKVATGEAATLASRHAHQICGAMGTTSEFDLQLFTRRALSWRDEYGNEAFWARALGQSLAAAGSGRLWSWMSDSG